MGCFDGLISVHGLCSGDDPNTLLYMDDVRLTLDDMSSFYTSEFHNAEDYFNKRYAFAVKSLEALIYDHFKGKYTATSLIDDHRLGVYGNSLATETGANFQGIQLEFTPSDVYYKFEISEVSLRLNHTGDVVVNVWDLLQNKILETVTVACVSGEINTAYLNKTFYSSKRPMNLFIGYDADGIESVHTPIRSGLCCGKKSCYNSYLNATGVEVNGTFYDQNTSQLQHTGGLSVIYSIVCDHNKWLCAYSQSVALPLAYKTAEIMVSDALLNTSGERATNHHTINRDELAERYKFYQAKFNETFDGLLSNMRLPSNKCFSCDTPVRHKAFAL